MIKKLKHKFILIVSVVMLVFISIFIGMIYTGFYAVTFVQIRQTTDFIVEHGGTVPDEIPEGADKTLMGLGDVREELRYFRVFVGRENGVTGFDLEHIASVSVDSAVSIFKNTPQNKRTGFISGGKNVYSFRFVPDDGYVLYLDCTRDLLALRYMLFVAIAMGAVLFLIFFVIVWFSANLAVRPIAENMEKQKQFITNAGHELKTPLAIISANTEVIEMMDGKNEWTESTLSQVKRLSGLVSSLISLSRMEEREDIVLHPVNLSEQTQDVADSFRAVAAKNGKTLTAEIREDIIVRGDEGLLHELVNILVDNAVKYCDDCGTVCVSLAYRAKEKGARLVVSNDYAEGEGVDYSRFFERFYREDQSHNNNKSGYGIGLSMAREIVQTCRGRISVEYKDGVIRFVVVF